MPFNLTDKRRVELTEYLFPRSEDRWNRGQKIHSDIPPFTREELISSAALIKSGRAPGPDGITPEAVKSAVVAVPEAFLNILNDLLKRQEFPKIWKLASISLIWKGKPPESPSAFRPICMLSMVGKLYERLIKERIEQELERNGGLSERQFGFRRGRSTVDAVKTVVEAAKRCRRRWFMVVALDVQNAFNSAVWSVIVRELRAKKIPEYLVNTVESYFSERTIKVTKSKTIDMTAGVPQGSVLGPLLWNILYDQVLRLSLPEGVTSIAYADDLAIMAEAINEVELERQVNESLMLVSDWMVENGLSLAAQKTEAIVLRGPRKRDQLNIEIAGTRVIPVKCMRYLGVFLDEKLSFSEHIKRSTEKAGIKMAALTRILPNVGGPSDSKRAVLCGVIHSIVLYAAPVWQEALRVKCREKLLLGIQRKALLRVASGYRTVSTMAIQVLTGIPPVSLLVEERSRLYQLDNSHLQIVKKREREITIDKWQKMWEENTETAAWTRALIPDLRPWMNCQHRSLDFFLTQFLSGHGSFRSYTEKMKLTQDSKCMYCGVEDTAEHTVLVCSRWNSWREELDSALGQRAARENIVEEMIASKVKWDRVKSFVKKVMLQKKREERTWLDTGSVPQNDQT